MLEQIAYEVPKSLERKQVVYQISDLESLSATGGFGGFGGIDGKDRKKYGIVKGPSIKVGTSNLSTVLRVDNIAKLHPLDRGKGIPTTINSFNYFSATGKPLGILGQLNYEEMSTLLEKYSKEEK